MESSLTCKEHTDYINSKLNPLGYVVCSLRPVLQGVQSSRKPASSVERKSVDNKHTLFNSELHFSVTVDRLATAVNKD
jgi:hypothetical protein